MLSVEGFYFEIEEAQTLGEHFRFRHFRRSCPLGSMYTKKYLIPTVGHEPLGKCSLRLQQSALNSLTSYVNERYAQALDAANLLPKELAAKNEYHRIASLSPVLLAHVLVSTKYWNHAYEV